MWYKGYNFALRNTDEAPETTETNEVTRTLQQLTTALAVRPVNKADALAAVLL